MKTCKKCKIEKDLASFSKAKTADGLRGECRDCVKVYNENYRKLNRDKLLVCYKKKYLKNRDKYMRYYKEKYWSNIEEIREKSRLSHIKNPEKARLRAKLWREANPVRFKETQRQCYISKKSNPDAYQKILKDGRKAAEAITDSYVANKFKLPVHTLRQYPELIEAKRAQIMILRAIKKPKCTTN